MFNSKLKLSALLTLTATVFILTQTIFTASAKTADSPPVNFSALWSFSDAPTFFNLQQDDANKLAPALCAAPPANIVSWYRGENNAVDSIGINNGALQNGVSFTAGKVGQAFNFTDENQRVEVPDNDSLDLTNAVTLEAWVAPSQIGNLNNATTIMHKGDINSFGNQPYSLHYNREGTAVFRVGNSSTFSLFTGSTTVLPLNTFTHIVGTYDGITSKIYINGILEGSSVENIGTLVTNNLPLRIGNNGSAGFVGKIDEPTIYSRALSASEVQSIFNAGNAGKCFPVCTAPPSNLISWYRGENDAVDSQGANNGMLNNGANFTSGKVGQAFNLDGVDDFVQLPANASLNSSSITVESWINPQTFATNSGGFVFASRDPLSTEGFSVFVSNNGELLVNVRTPNTAISPPTFFSAPNVIGFGQFQHVAVTYDAGSGTLSAFVNGAGIPLNGGTTLGGAIQPTTNHFIGRRQDAATGEGISGAAYFKGSIDELSIYSRALSQTEIQSIFNAGSAGKCLTSPLQIAPATANVLTGATQTFTASGGTAPYTFSILTNNSGGSINASSGVYIAGTTANVTDTIRVADAFGATADAIVNVSGTANRLAFTVQPTNAVAGQNISAVQIAVQDANGSTITNSNAAITIAIANNPNGGTLSGTLTKNAVNGVAVFDNLSINRNGTGYTLQAASAGLTAATSSIFNIASGAPSQLAFSVQPGNTNADTPISPAVQVRVLDQSGNLVTSATNSISLIIGNNPAGGTLSGTLTRTASNGAAVFGDLKINNAGNGYTLIASSGSLTSATSAAFNIVSTFEVTNTNDTGAGSLRSAIQAANSAPGTQTITFNIPGTAPFTIKPTFELPRINDRTIIDGTTQPGFNGTPIIELDGELGRRARTSTPGIGINANSSVVKGLVINNWNIGIITNALAVEVKGNYIGTDTSGTIAKPNGVGISILQGYAIIGGADAADRNVISGNTSAGIVRDRLDYPVVSSVDGNYIGTKVDGVSALPNGTGILVAGRRMFIGNNAPNVIAFNVQHGIEINSNNNAGFIAEAGIAVNSIFSNGGRGIKIGRGFSPTINDSLDADAGDNNIQNFPVITSAISANGTTVIRGTMNSEPSKLYFIRFFSNQACDSSGFGEGENFIGITNLSTDASGIKSFTATFNTPIAIGSSITATATVFPGITSEFSRCQTVSGNSHAISGRIADTNNAPMPSVAVKIQGTNISTLTDSSGIYSFNNLPDGFNYTIVPTLPGVVFAPLNRLINNLSADQTNQNFTGTRLARISGQVLSIINGASFAVSGATVTLSGGATAQTDINGRYVFNNIAPGNYTATPAKTGFAFTPSSVSLNVSGDRTADFSSILTAGLSGRLLTNYVGINAINADGGNELYLLNGLGGTAFGCIQNQCQIALDAKLSPDGSKIAYIEATRRNFPNFDFVGGKIYIANFDGSNRQLAYNFPTDQNLFGNSLGWSPDGTKLVFTVAQKSIRIINTDGTNETTVVAVANEFYAAPEWSPDGTKILFEFGRSINTININGANRFRLTSGTFDDNAKWSPNGAKIAFIRRPTLNSTGKIFTMNADGSGAAAITIDSDYINVLWSPDGAKLAFTKRGTLPTDNFYGAVDPNGANLQIIRSIAGNILSWSPIFAPVTPTGANVSTNVGAANVTFANVSNAGTTTITPIPTYTFGVAPTGFSFSGQTYEITTTATISAPITICFTAPTSTTETRFNRLSVLHYENGAWTDRTISRDFPTRRICAITSSLSPFAVAEQIDANAPRISGLVQDASGNPFVTVPVYLTGAETAATTTDSDGRFSFVNLIPNGNYNVQPKQIGYLFSENNQDFVDLNGESSVIFTGAAVNFQISGRVINSNGDGINGVSVDLGGAAQTTTTTGANGIYTFTNLPADGAYIVTPSGSSNSFSQNQVVINPLSADFGEVNFQTLAPTAAPVSVGGRVMIGRRGISGARISMTDSEGAIRIAVTDWFGVYRFTEVAAGEIYTVGISHKRYRFSPNQVVVSVVEDLENLNFTASP